jgi:hypothetical protein
MSRVPAAPRSRSAGSFLPDVGARAARALLGLPIAAALLLLAGCGERLPTYRYRMTVEVDTPEGLRTGSSVIEVRTRKGPGFPGPEAGGILGEVRGEAVAVDLGTRGTLFALLRGARGTETGAGGYAWALLPNPPRDDGGIEAMRENYRALASAQGTAALSPDQYPMLVRFRDLSQPTTVQEVAPGALQEHFGQGVRLRRITVEITNDKPTAEIAQLLPWLGTTSGYLDGQFTQKSHDLANRLDRGAFKRRD